MWCIDASMWIMDTTWANGGAAVLCADVIGVVKSVSDMSTVIGRQSQKEIKKREVNLVDDSQAQIRLTLWGTDVRPARSRPHAPTDNAPVVSDGVLIEECFQFTSYYFYRAVFGLVQNTGLLLFAKIASCSKIALSFAKIALSFAKIALSFAKTASSFAKIALSFSKITLFFSKITLSFAKIESFSKTALSWCYKPCLAKFLACRNFLVKWQVGVFVVAGRELWWQWQSHPRRQVLSTVRVGRLVKRLQWFNIEQDCTRSWESNYHVVESHEVKNVKMKFRGGNLYAV